MREAVFYCLKRNTLIAVGFFTVILYVDFFVTYASFSLFGAYGFIPGIILTSIVLGVSGTYINQILKSSINGKDEPPVWELEDADIQGVLSALTPFLFTLFEASILSLLFVQFVFTAGHGILFFFSKVFHLSAGFFFAMLFPVNHLNYAVIRGFNVMYVLSMLKKSSIIKIFTLFPCGMIIILSLFLNKFVFFILAPIIFFAFIALSRALGVMFYEDNREED